MTLGSDGSISGKYTGKWSVVEGTSYINLTIANIQYKGVMVEQVMESNTTSWPSVTFAATKANKTVAFTALTKSGVTVWGYRTGDTPTGIFGIEEMRDGENEIWFTLDGCKVSKPMGKGVYIKNGNKYIIK